MSSFALEELGGVVFSREDDVVVFDNETSGRGVNALKGAGGGKGGRDAGSREAPGSPMDSEVRNAQVKASRCWLIVVVACVCIPWRKLRQLGSTRYPTAAVRYCFMQNRVSGAFWQDAGTRNRWSSGMLSRYDRLSSSILHLYVDKGQQRSGLFRGSWTATVFDQNSRI